MAQKVLSDISVATLPCRFPEHNIIGKASISTISCSIFCTIGLLYHSIYLFWSLFFSTYFNLKLDNPTQTYIAKSKFLFFSGFFNLILCFKI